jgi:GMP synthase (glutamine-hydrolysing)
MKIGILLTGRSPDSIQEKHGDYDAFFNRYLEGRGFDFVTYEVLDGELPASPQDAQGWLITGSRFGAYEDHAWIPPLEEFLRATFALKLPIFGVCFGHQILAQALGGQVEKFSGGWSVGPKVYKSDVFGDQTLVAWHQDQVTKRPEMATVVGSSDFCANAILAYGNQALTIQPHPEFTTDFMGDLLETRGKSLPQHIQDGAIAAKDEPLTRISFADAVEAFFKTSRS